MIRLLNAGFTRLRKNKVFWILSIFTIGFALLILSVKYGNMKRYGETVEIGQLLLNYPIIIGIVIAIFTSLFLGVEYSDGTLRNKISIGHKRINIYLSNLVLITITSLLFYIIFFIIITMIGIPLFSVGTISVTQLLIKTSIALITIIAYSSIFTFFASVISNKTIIAITTILIAFLLMIFGIYCYSMLNTPKTIEQVTIENGETKVEKVPNPKYPNEQMMKVYQALLDVNPAGQMFQLGERSSKLEILPLYSFLNLLIFTGLGLILFQKKELK